MKYRVTLQKDEDGTYVAKCPSFLGCISQGKTRSEVLCNIKDAIEGHIQSLKKHNESIPPPIDEEFVEINV
jgi:antitoxin HicB